VNSANAEVVIKPEDLIGRWKGGRKNQRPEPSCGCKHSNKVDAVHAVALDRGQMRRDRSVVKAEISPSSLRGETTTNCARVWDEKNQQVFVARAGTYTIAGDELHQTPMIALDTSQLRADRVLKIIRLDKDTMVTQNDDPELGYTALEITYRRID
jgi:hypothetical protein